MKLLKLLVVAYLISILSACSSNISPIATSASQPTELPTQTEAPTLIPTPIYWNGIPIIPGAINGHEDMGDYQFTLKSSSTNIKAYYQQEMAKLGWTIRPDLMASVSTDLAFNKGGDYIFFLIQSEGDNNLVYIHPTHE
jgi:hypothetical protein